MIAWLGQRPAKTRLLLDRILEGMREIAVLFLAFAPLDVALNRSSGSSTSSLLLFVILGLFFFAGALIIEWSRTDDN